jgi:hypothetical protein
VKVGHSFAAAAAILKFAITLAAQGSSSASIQNLLPPDAQIIESADLSAAAGKPRQLVLWMQSPQKVQRDTNPENGHCGDSVYGDYWYGPTRLSLLDAAQHRLINTVEIRDFFEVAGDDEHSFPIPFFVSNDFYHVPRPDARKQGTPKILDLRDLTGEGLAGQFVLFEYEACGIALTSALGYSRTSDLAVQYHVEVLGGVELQGGAGILGTKDAPPRLDLWVATIFGRKPVRPGYWIFAWQPGHGASVTIHEEVSFDRARQLFVDRQTTTPVSGTTPPNR